MQTLSIISAVAVVIITGIAIKIYSYKDSRSKRTIEFLYPPATVFSYIDDERQLIRWINGLEIPPQGPPSASRVGSKRLQCMTVGGVKYNYEIEIMEYEKDKKIVLKMIMPHELDSKISYNLKPTTIGTEFEFENIAIFHHPIAKLFDFLVMNNAGKKLDKDLQTLRNIIDTDANKR